MISNREIIELGATWHGNDPSACYIHSYTFPAEFYKNYKNECLSIVPNQFGEFHIYVGRKTVIFNGKIRSKSHLIDILNKAKRNMTNINNLKFWPWMWSENKFKIMVPLFLVIISAVNIYNREFDSGFMFLYALTILAIVVVFFGIRSHWKTLMDIKSKNVTKYPEH